MVPAAYSGNVHHHHLLQALLHGKSATVKEEGGRSGRIKKSDYNDFFQQKIKQNAPAPVSAEPRERRPVVIAEEKGEGEACAV